eukprot:gene463-842_t
MTATEIEREGGVSRAAIGGDLHEDASPRDTAADFSNFFGDNPKPYLMSPYDQYGRENFALPEAYLGYSPYMTNVMITLITQEHMWPAQQMSERRDHYVRYGLAMILEHGFMNTEKGRLCYTMNLQQIRNAVLETVYLGVLEALLNCKTVDEMWNERYGGNIRTATLARKALMMEVEDWATIQKTPHGWDLLDSRCKRYLRAKGVQPDTWIVPEGMKPYVTQVRRENYVYALAGPDGPKNFDSTRNGKSHDTTIDARNDCKIFEAKAFELPDLTEPVDVTRRVRSIGEFFLMQPEQTYGQATQYDSSHRNIAIFDEDVDAFVEITLRDALLNDAFFNEETRKPAWSRKKLPYMRVSPDTPFDQWTSRAHADDDDAGDGALLGDLPETDDADNNVNNSHPHAVPLSSTTTIRFASSFFTADDQTCFSRCFGREIPSVLRAMDVAKNMTTPPMNSTETSIFQKILNAMQSYILYPDTTKYISEIQSFYAHSDNAYSLWMFAHSITWEATHHRDGEASIAGENDCGYSSALMNSYSALHRGQHIPDPPRWCDRSITILTRAIMYALLHTRPLLKQILKHAEPSATNDSNLISEYIQFLREDICDKSGAIIPTGESSKRQRIPYAAISCTSSSFDTVSAAVATWCVEGAGSYVSANLKALLEVATFSALNVHATLSGPSASSTTLCDGMSIILRSPIGYDSYRGVRRLAESGESIYEPEACANLVRNYDTLHQIAQPLFSTSALHQIKDSFFGPCVLNHKSTGNIHIDIGAVDEKTMDNAIALYKIAPDDLLHQLVELRPDECQVEFHGRTSSTWSWTNHNSAQYADEIRKRCPAFTMIHEMMAQIDTVAGSNVYSTGKPFEEYVKGLGELWMRMQRMWCDGYGYTAGVSTKLWASASGESSSKIWWGLCQVYLVTIDYILTNSSDCVSALNCLKSILITAIELNTGDMQNWNSRSHPFAEAASRLLLACAPKLSALYQTTLLKSDMANSSSST